MAQAAKSSSLVKKYLNAPLTAFTGGTYTNPVVSGVGCDIGPFETCDFGTRGCHIVHFGKLNFEPVFRPSKEDGSKGF